MYLLSHQPSPFTNNSISAILYLITDSGIKYRILISFSRNNLTLYQKFQQMRYKLRSNCNDLLRTANILGIIIRLEIHLSTRQLVLHCAPIDG